MDAQVAGSLYAEGLRIAAVGIVGVFVNLIIIMLLVQALGLAFRKKTKAKRS